MGFVELILTVCTLTEPASCEERHLSFVDEGSLVQCMSQAPPAIAEWANSHPGRKVVKWRCSYPGNEDSFRLALDPCRHVGHLHAGAGIEQACRLAD